MFENFTLPERLVPLLNDLRELVFQLRKKRQDTWGRVDPMAELFFDRTEKAPALGFPPTVTLYDSVFIAGDVQLGDNVFVGQFCMLDGSGGLFIGEHTTISAGSRIMTHDNCKKTLSGGEMPIDREPVHIGDHCYIGVNSTILKGVTLGHHTVVGAGAVVTKSFPPYSIIAGCPAKTIGRVDMHEDTVSFCYGDNARNIAKEPTA